MVQRKRFWVVSIITALSFVMGLSAQVINIKSRGEWRSGNYLDLVIDGNYAYIAANGAGVDILDIHANHAPFVNSHIDITGQAKKIKKQGNTLFILVNESGLVTVDASNPNSPSRTGQLFGFNNANDIAAADSYVYVSDIQGIHTVDVSIPASPVKKKLYPLVGAKNLHIQNNLLFAIGYKEDGSELSLYLFDISEPGDIRVKGRYDGVAEYSSYCVEGDRVYMKAFLEDFTIIDISDPANPVRETTGPSFNAGTGLFMVIEDNYMFAVSSGATGDRNVSNSLSVWDITEPGTSVRVYKGESEYGWSSGAVLAGDTLYTLNGYKGLSIYDVSTPTAPVREGGHLTVNSFGRLCVPDKEEGSYAYAAGKYSGLTILDKSNPVRPRRVAQQGLTGMKIAEDVDVQGNYAYLAYKGYRTGGLAVMDVSSPQAPQTVALLEMEAESRAVAVSGNVVFLGTTDFTIVDVSNPAAPVEKTTLQVSGRVSGITVEGNYAYVASYHYAPTKYDNEIPGSFAVIDISDPEAPAKKAELIDSNTWSAYDVDVRGQYAYLAAGTEGMILYDVSLPSAPVLKGVAQFGGYGAIAVSADKHSGLVYVSVGAQGIFAVDVSNPANPVIVGSYLDSELSPWGLYAYRGEILATERYEGRFFTFSTNGSGDWETLTVSSFQFNFAAVKGNPGLTTGTQSLLTGSVSGEILDWNTSTDQDWMTLDPVSGKTGDEVFVSVDASGLAPGSYDGTISFTSPRAGNVTRVGVHLRVYGGAATSGPFGTFAVPGQQEILSGSVPLTGWALDDIGVRNVQIFVEDGDTMPYIGDAVFVEGARPDVADDFPGYPMNQRAGWGYMLLSNYLPGGGNGNYAFHAYAVDVEGNRVGLGSRTILCDNKNAEIPFGTIDTPAQGAAVSGPDYYNYGWALTPLPNTIPADGSGITVWLDGEALGTAVYGLNRQDIENLFPGYNNSDGAVGFYILDTTAYDNGLHSIAWSVTDDAGNGAGIGSRYFKIHNSSGSFNRPAGRRGVGRNVSPQGHSNHCAPAPWRKMFGPGLKRDKAACPDKVTPWPQAVVRSGYGTGREGRGVFPDETGTYRVRIQELEPLEICFPVESVAGPGAVSGIVPLKTGSSYDENKGIFRWLPGPGFVGEYEFVVMASGGGHEYRQRLIVNISAKGGKSRE